MILKQTGHVAAHNLWPFDPSGVKGDQLLMGHRFDHTDTGEGHRGSVVSVTRTLRCNPHSINY